MLTPSPRWVVGEKDETVKIKTVGIQLPINTQLKLIKLGANEGAFVVVAGCEHSRTVRFIGFAATPG